MHAFSRSLRLESNDCVAVIGGGPAGSFFAIRLLREARRHGRQLRVVIVEKHGPADLNTDVFQCRGCNFCAGGISPRLDEALERDGLHVPGEIIQSEVDYIWVQGEWKNFRLRVPAGLRMYSVFRGPLPSRRGDSRAGFDGFLLGQAVREGAEILRGEVQRIRYSEAGRPVLTVTAQSGERLTVDAAFVAIATGINAHCGRDYRDDAVIASVRRMNKGFVPGKSRQTLIFELDAGEEYLRQHLFREVYYVEFGSKHLAVEHAALIPKGRFLTVVMMGRCVDKADSPHERRRIVHEFLTLPQISRILPGIESAPVSCSCTPRMSVKTAKRPFAERLAIIGDAAGCRLNKDGLFSAYLTGSRLAETALHDGIDERSLASGYGKTIQWMAADNLFGRIVFAASRISFGRPLIGRVMYQAFATEYKVRNEDRRPFGAVLWQIASATADYREVLRRMCSPRVLGSILVGAAVTLRNVTSEALLGLRWGEYGRYPTVVLKEDRATVKQRIAPVSGTPPGALHDFERMYVIKIRGSQEEILDELGKFGQPGARFANLRLLEVRRICGEPNEARSVIRYRVPLAGLSAELRLARSVGEALVYEVDGRFCDNGRLIFAIDATKNGNHTLTVYAAFDYKKGDSLAGRALWRTIKALFPEFMHDVVWNHGLCAIKEAVERAHDCAASRCSDLRRIPGPAPGRISAPGGNRSRCETTKARSGDRAAS